ncbi:MAG: hypothetical protein IT196_06980 [Acidimicrobiales bacterium]|nr:hypothetical protein [Acidimicrobiales bacterium]
MRSSTARRGLGFTDDTWEATLGRLKTPDGLIHVDIADLLGELAGLRAEVPPGDDPDWPLLLSAGERRSFTANTIHPWAGPRGTRACPPASNRSEQEGRLVGIIECRGAGG